MALTPRLADSVFTSFILVVPDFLPRGRLVWQPCCKETFTSACFLPLAFWQVPWPGEACVVRGQLGK